MSCLTRSVHGCCSPWADGIRADKVVTRPFMYRNWFPGLQLLQTLDKVLADLCTFALQDSAVLAH